MPLTTQIAALRYPGTILIESDATNGLSKPSVALGFHLCAIDRKYVEDPIGYLPGETIELLLQSLLELTRLHGA